MRVERINGNVDEWETVSIDLEGADGVSTLQIRGAGKSDGESGRIDNVRLVEVP